MTATTMERPTRPAASRWRLLDEEALRGLEEPGRVFHVTPAHNVASIVRAGLVARRGARSAMAEYEGDLGVYCFTDAAGALRHAHPATGWLTRYPDPDWPDAESIELVVLAVDVRGIESERIERPTDHWEWAGSQSIAPSRIRVLGRIT